MESYGCGFQAEVVRLEERCLVLQQELQEMTAATGELQAEFEKTSKMNLELTNENERLSTSITEIQGQVWS